MNTQTPRRPEDYLVNMQEARVSSPVSHVMQEGRAGIQEVLRQQYTLPESLPSSDRDQGYATSSNSEVYAPGMFEVHAGSSGRGGIGGVGGDRDDDDADDEEDPVYAINVDGLVDALPLQEAKRRNRLSQFSMLDNDDNDRDGSPQILSSEDATTPLADPRDDQMIGGGGGILRMPNNNTNSGNSANSGVGSGGDRSLGYNSSTGPDKNAVSVHYASASVPHHHAPEDDPNMMMSSAAMMMMMNHHQGNGYHYGYHTSTSDPDQNYRSISGGAGGGSGSGGEDQYRHPHSHLPLPPHPHNQQLHLHHQQHHQSHVINGFRPGDMALPQYGHHPVYRQVTPTSVRSYPELPNVRPFNNANGSIPSPNPSVPSPGPGPTATPSSRDQYDPTSAFRPPPHPRNAAGIPLPDSTKMNPITRPPQALSPRPKGCPRSQSFEGRPGSAQSILQSSVPPLPPPPAPRSLSTHSNSSSSSNHHHRHRHHHHHHHQYQEINPISPQQQQQQQLQQQQQQSGKEYKQQRSHPHPLETSSSADKFMFGHFGDDDKCSTCSSSSDSEDFDYYYHHMSPKGGSKISYVDDMGIGGTVRNGSSSRSRRHRQKQKQCVLQ